MSVFISCLQNKDTKIETLIRRPPARAKGEYGKEVKASHSIPSHRNVLGFVGATWKPVNERLQVYEFCSLGNLRDFLRQA